MATGQIVPNFILQVGQRPLQDQKVTLAVLAEGVFSRSSGPGCAWCSGQRGQGLRRSEVFWGLRVGGEGNPRPGRGRRELVLHVCGGISSQPCEPGV